MDIHLSFVKESTPAGIKQCRWKWSIRVCGELESLIDLGSVHPALPPGHPFENVKANYYWSSTTTANLEDSAWILHFYIGMVTNGDKGGSHYVWYVRNKAGLATEP
jgi:hypothetical protein